MTTPSTNTWAGIVKDAMEDAGLLRSGSQPNSEDYAKNGRRLLDMVRLWQTQGVKLWMLLDQSITLTASLATYTLGPAGAIITVKPMQVLQGYYLDSNSNKRPIYPLSWDEYLRLSNTTQEGAVSQYFVDKQQSNLVVKLWSVPDTQAATGTVHLLIRQQVTTFTELDETMNFPDEWRIALRWGLADEICTGQPAEIMARCASRAATYRMMLEDWDVEDAPTRIEPDSRTGTAGRFAA